LSFLEDMRHKYLIRRVILFLAVVLVIAIAIVALMLMSPTQFEMPGNVTGNMTEETTENETEWVPPPVIPPVLDETPEEEETDIVPDDTIPDDIIPDDVTPEETCTMAPLEYLGCLKEYEGENIFGAYGLNFDDNNVKRIIKKVNMKCDTELPDRDCIVDTTVYESENSWVCEWECLDDVGSCEIYKMHLAVAVLRNYVPPEEAFVARTENFKFYVMYVNNEGDWTEKFSYTKSPTVALYNDVYHVGEVTEVTYPDILKVEPGDSFCFDIHADRSCVCEVEVTTFSVGDCPQLPADLRGICDNPITEVYLNKGKNNVCFNVLENATEAFYTYDFRLTDGIEYIPAGNAFIKSKRLDCCVNASFKGFLDIED
jgi:hypothetical protein